jgi:predicted DNA-binding transcriptional regulator YafY
MAGVMNRIQRLERLRGLLAGAAETTAAELASGLGVSLRTVMRDLDVLREDGVLLETDRGRGGGVRLARGHSAGRVQLSTAEALGLLVGLAIAERLEAPLLDASTRSARQKIAAIFSRTERDRIMSLRRRILVGEAASPRVLASYDAAKGGNEAARRAFFDMRLLAIHYRDERGAQSSRTIEPQYLYLNPPVWYVLAWDRLRDAVRAFRFDRIQHAETRSDSFRLRPSAPFLAAAEADIETV